MNNPSTSRITIIDVGTPPASTRNNCEEWESLQLHFHGFENLPVSDGVSSPEFTCFGHRWCVQIFPGGRPEADDGMISLYLEHHSATSDEGMVGVYLHNLSSKSVKLQYGFSVKDKKGQVKKEFTRVGRGKEFAAFGASRPNDGIFNIGGRPNFCQRSKIIDSLVDGALIIEVRFRQTAETRRVCTPSEFM